MADPNRRTVAESVALAVRSHRRRLGMSQRDYAAYRGWSTGRISRIETDAGRFRLSELLEALAPTGYSLTVVSAREVAGSDPSWEPTDLLARDRGGRRFPAHRPVYEAVRPPRWWWMDEATDAFSRPPRWTAAGFAWRREVSAESTPHASVGDAGGSPSSGTSSGTPPG